MRRQTVLAHVASFGYQAACRAVPIATILALAGCSLFKSQTTADEPKIEQVTLQDYLLDIKRQIAVFQSYQIADAKIFESNSRQKNDEYECGNGGDVFILTSVKLDVLTTTDRNWKADGTGNAAGGFITIPKPTGSKETKANQHLIYTQTILPELAQDQSIFTKSNMDILNKAPSPIAVTIERLKNALDVTSKKHQETKKGAFLGKLPCLTAAPISKKVTDHTFTLELDTTTDYGFKATVVVADYGIGLEHTNTETNTLTVTYQVWPWDLLPKSGKVGGKPISSDTEFIYCQGENHLVNICKVTGKESPVAVSPNERKTLSEQLLLRNRILLDAH
ncbi:hypothetical protein AWB64_01272 [Caballeronia sordidicola]|uniref:Lipoprotein n=1 Tax=Caballeronia sordidicola TaxID=196367 RepID=A0A158FHU9_CABSO|nr:hypothetical protein [Caballeronia sordidicola]SAL18630.1 hypothetical protein AWB64_01272 [Caballeronia sordidicola]